MSCDVEALEVGANIRDVESAIAPIERVSLGIVKAEGSRLDGL